MQPFKTPMSKHPKHQRVSSSKPAWPPSLVKRLSEGSFILLLTTALFLLLSLSTYHMNDPGLFSKYYSGQLPLNAGGQVGAFLARILFASLGYVSFLLPITLAWIGWVILREQSIYRSTHYWVWVLKIIGLILLLSGSCGLLALELPLSSDGEVYSAGGVVGQFLARRLMWAFNVQGAALLLMAMVLVGVTWLTGLSWVLVAESIGYYALYAYRFSLRLIISLVSLTTSTMGRLSHYLKQNGYRAPNQYNLAVQPVKKSKATPLLKSNVINTSAVGRLAPTETKVVKKVMNGELPALSLLSKGQPGKPMGGYSHQELEALSRDVEQHLLDFGIQADVVAVHPGPVITRFELQLAAGIKVSKLTALAKDLARSLSVTSVRVVEIIPGKTVVGLELPNQNRATVSLSEVLSADVYHQAHSPLTLALGVDIAGHPMVVDLAKMPHLLVAGTTGSGKSVGINAMILSLLFKSSPEQVRLIMVDPKMLELSVYDGIPHLLTPVVTDMKEAASALRWCVNEMERRYRLMASFGVRNLAGFNTKIKEARAKGETLVDPLWKPIDSTDTSAPALEPLPYVVVIIDELADMMMVVGKKVEQLIARIAQKARAAGIHLILATQRPSVDVLTGLIKSNIPTRISFQVSSKIDSRTILDQQGAEQLLGHGDMLFLSPGAGAPLRVHGAFVDDKEVHRVADDWRARGTPDYIEDIIQQGSSDPLDNLWGEEAASDDEADPIYDEAVEFVIQTRKASISAVQRRFKIGYNRAARLVEDMERAGLVGPLEGGMRDVLVPTINDD